MPEWSDDIDEATPDSRPPNIAVSPVKSGLRRAKVFEDWPPSVERDTDHPKSRISGLAKGDGIPVGSVTRVAKAFAGDGWAIRTLQILLLVTVILPFLLNMRFEGQTLAPAPASVVGFESTLSLLNPGSNVLIVTDWDGDVQGELMPVGNALIDDLFRRDVKLSVISISPSGAPFLSRLLTRAADTGDRTYGEDFLNYGYLPGEQAALLAFAGDFGEAVRLDYHGNPIEEQPMAEQFSRLHQADLVVLMSGDAGRTIASLQQLSARYEVPIVVATSATAGLDLRPYTDPNAYQIAGLIAGLADLERWKAHKQRSDEYRPRGISISAGLLVLLSTVVVANLSLLIALGRRVVRPRLDSKID